MSCLTSHRVLTLTCLLLLLGASPAVAQAASKNRGPENLFANAHFQNGRDLWRMDRAGKTDVQFTVDDKDAAAGQRSALLRIGAVENWGVQFGQSMEAPAQGKTCTFAVLAKSTSKPVALRLEIERQGKPYDRAAASESFTVTKDAWTELHVTFMIEKPFQQGWFAYVSCKQADSEFRLDGFRLVEGSYVAYQEAARQEAAAAAVNLFDTGVAAPIPLTGDAIARRNGWTQVPEDKTDHVFRGDAVVANDRLVLVLRRGGPGAELYSLGADRATLRAVLAPGGAEAAGKLTSLAIVENGPGEVTIDVAFQSSGGKTRGSRLGLAMGQPFVKSEPREGASGLCVEAPSRFVVLPDFFADDIVIDAAEIPVSTGELPSENFLLHMLPGRDAIVMTVASNRGQDARIELSGQGAQRLVSSSQMYYGARGKIWVAVLQGRDIWHQREVAKEEAGKIVPLDWIAPLAAQWRVDWRLASGVTGSWEMVRQLQNGEYLKPGWFGTPTTLPESRKRWTTVIGSFPYPCWIDRKGRGFLQPLGKPDRFQGPAVIYPINRVRETPLDEFTLVDVVRATLGVGPCEYILDVEGQGAAMKGRATCATRDTLKPIYAAKQQRQKKDEIERALTEVVVFVKHIRARIDQYVEFGHEMLAYIEQQKTLHPELKGFLAEMETCTRAIDAAVAKRKSNIRNPQYVVDLTEKFRRELLDYEGHDALAKCTAITHAIVTVGGNQDELVGECRNAVKVLRQRAGLATAADPRAADIAREIRDRTQKALRNATSYEAPRH